MTDDEALRIGRKAIEAARERVGENKQTLIKELETRIDTDPKTMEAFAHAGQLILKSLQETHH
jgi:hypothetical protein